MGGGYGELLEDRKVLSRSACIPPASRVGVAAGTLSGGALAASVMMTVHMALTRQCLGRYVS